MLGHASMAITPVLMRTLHNPKGRRIAEGKASLYSRTLALFLRVHLSYQVLDHSLQCPKIGVVDVLQLAWVAKARQSHLAPALSTPNDSATSVGRLPTRVLPQWYDRSIQNQELEPFYRGRISALFYTLRGNGVAS